MKVLIIGTGFGQQVMAPAYVRNGASVQVVSPRDVQAVDQAIGAGADLVSIHSPPFMHRRHVMMAFDRGLAVLCDKPFGANAAEAGEMRDRARELGLPNFLNFELRWQPARLRAKQLLDAGVIGDLGHVHWSMFGNALREQRYGWLFDAERAGGWLGAYGAHVIDAVCWWADAEVTQCGGMSRTEIPVRTDATGAAHPCTAEDAFSIWAVMRNGVTLNFDSAYSTSVTVPERAMLLGSEGALELLNDRELVLHRRDAPQEAISMLEHGPDHYAAALDPWLGEVLDALQTGRHLTPDFEDGVANTQVLDQLRATVTRAGRKH